MAALALAALAISVYLLVQSFAGGAVAGCAPGSGCDAVLASRWSRVWGLPVSAPAALVYAAVLWFLWCARPARPLEARVSAWSTLVVLAAVIAVAAAWFIGVQVWLIRTLCRYCMAAHAAGVVLALLIVAAAPWRRSRGQIGVQPATLLLAAVVAAAGVAALAAGARPPRAQVSLLNNAVRVNPYEEPLLGSPEAPHVVVSLIDYTCRHCRTLHGFLEQARRRYGTQLAIVTLPMPLDAECNPYLSHTEPQHETACELARLALAVWRADRRAFEAYDAWLAEGESPPTPEAVRAKAVELVGERALESALRAMVPAPPPPEAPDASTIPESPQPPAEAGERPMLPWVDVYIQRTAHLYNALGRGPMPKLLVGSSMVEGRPGTAEELFALLEAELGVNAVEE